MTPLDPDSVEFHGSVIFTGKQKPWDSLNRKEERIEVLKEVLGIFNAATSPAHHHCTCAVHKNSFAGQDPMELAFTELCGWFDLFFDFSVLFGNAVTDSLPGGSASRHRHPVGPLLTTAGFDTDTAVGGLTAFSLLEVGGLLALPIFALPAILAGVPVSRGLVHTALLGIGRLRPVRDPRGDRAAH